MGLLRNPALRLFMALMITAGLYNYFLRPVNEFSFRMNDRGVSPIPGLEVSLQQSRIDPPTITIRVTNTNKEPVTILSYGSPLDGLALQLGLVQVTPDAANSPISISAVQVRRKWPPSAESLITIDAGLSQEHEVVIGEPVIVVKELGKRPTVEVKGRWEAVWAKGKGEVSQANLDDAPGGESFSGAFSSNNLEMTIG